MSSREHILNAVRANQPERIGLPEVPRFAPYFEDPVAKFAEVLSGIGASVVEVSDYAAIRAYLPVHFDCSKPLYAMVAELEDLAFANAVYGRPQDLHTTELMILPAAFGVAENGAVWITDALLPERVLPFIPEHLAVIVARDAIVRDMHEAYVRIGAAEYGWASFIAGPSKTADIEQSLVLGAHGPRSMTVFIINEPAARS